MTRVTVDIPEDVIRDAAKKYAEFNLTEIRELRFAVDQLSDYKRRKESGCGRCGTLRGTLIRFRPVPGHFHDGQNNLCEECARWFFYELALRFVQVGDPQRVFRLAGHYSDDVQDALRRIVPGRARSSSYRRESVEVYWAVGQEGHLVKIGIAACAEERCNQLGLTPLLIEPGGRDREQMLHERHARLRIPPSDLPAWVPYDGRTEWFWRRDEIDRYIAASEGWVPVTAEDLAVA